ncbi:MAG: hypothetical protein IJF83_10680 [Methanobrevibacter sp.]|nr:hypothetical protein [Methanobrevibacter sp.]
MTVTKENISEVTECQEKTVFNDKALSRKWSNQLWPILFEMHVSIRYLD